MTTTTSTVGQRFELEPETHGEAPATASSAGTTVPIEQIDVDETAYSPSEKDDSSKNTTANAALISGAGGALAVESGMLPYQLWKVYNEKTKPSAGAVQNYANSRIGNWKTNIPLSELEKLVGFPVVNYEDASNAAKKISGTQYQPETVSKIVRGPNGQILHTEHLPEVQATPRIDISKYEQTPAKAAMRQVSNKTSALRVPVAAGLATHNLSRAMDPETGPVEKAVDYTGAAAAAASPIIPKDVKVGKYHIPARAIAQSVGAVPVVKSLWDKVTHAEGGAVQGYKGGKLVSGLETLAKKAFDPRFDSRILEQEKLKNLTRNVEHTGVKDVPRIHLPDYEGHPFITSMSDRTAGGSRLLGVNDVKFNRPVELTGGQEFMYNNPGMAWASGKNPVNQIMREAQAAKKATGKDPLYMPWRMAPTASDFAHMTGETMLAHADSVMSAAQKKDLNNTVRKFLPDWKGIEDPTSLSQFHGASANARKGIQNAIDRDLRGSGALGIGETRLAIADPKQIAAPEGGLMHVAKIHADKPVIDKSGNVTYPFGVPGEGIGQLNKDHIVTEMLPGMVAERGIANPMMPSAQDLRALQMKPYSGIIDDKLLKSLGYKKGGAV